MTGSTLIAKLEAATEGSRTLDCEIAFLDGWRCKTIAGEGQSCGDDGLYWKKGDRTWTMQDGDSYPPNYTTSIDSAMTIVPWLTMRIDISGSFNDIEMYSRDPVHPACKSVTVEGSRPLALTICIAALKARATP